MDENPKPGVTPTQILMLMGGVFGFGLLVGAVFAFRANEAFIAWTLLAAAVIDGVTFGLLWRYNPLAEGQRDSGLEVAKRRSMVAELERRHAEGEIDTQTLERVRRSLEEEEP